MAPADYISENRFVPCSPWQWFFRRSLMIKNDIWFRENTICEDVDWTHRLVLCAKLIQYQPVLLSHYVIDSGTQTALSYARAANVYAYMNAGRCLYELKDQYAAVGHKAFLFNLVAGYISQSLKYYLAIWDGTARKVDNMKNIPEELVLYGKWEKVRRHPLLYAYATNILSPFVRLYLKIKARFYFRGIKL
jgi:hypothetical protein